MEPIPRMLMEPPSPGWPLELMTWTPALRPWRAWVTLDVEIFWMSSFLTTVADPVKEALDAVPYATTMVSSSISASSTRTMSMTLLPLTGTVCS